MSSPLEALLCTGDVLLLLCWCTSTRIGVVVVADLSHNKSRYSSSLLIALRHIARKGTIMQGNTGGEKYLLCDPGSELQKGKELEK